MHTRKRKGESAADATPPITSRYKRPRLGTARAVPTYAPQGNRRNTGVYMMHDTRITFDNSTGTSTRRDTLSPCSNAEFAHANGSQASTIRNMNSSPEQNILAIPNVSQAQLGKVRKGRRPRCGRCAGGSKVESLTGTRFPPCSAKGLTIKGASSGGVDPSKGVL